MSEANIEKQDKDKGKMGFFSVLCISIGSIIGAGVFASLPVGVAASGPGVEWAFVLAAVSLLLLGVPMIMLASALPGKNAPYLHITRLTNPIVGFLQITIVINLVILLAMLAQVFAMFAGAYLPDVPPLLLSIGVIVIFAAVTSFGVSTTATVQNIMVVLLLVALLMFIFMGFPAMVPGNISIGQIIAPEGMDFVVMGVTVVA
ncbi:MAG: APC family permease, partial [Propionibacteriaceae bacterium]|nr:APC family permease [Propionibacteriaceae bacterium]